MDDLISRQAAIDALVNGLSIKPSQTVVRGIIEAIPAAERWIPVTERLPEKKSGHYPLILLCLRAKRIYGPWYDYDVVIGSRSGRGYWYTERHGVIPGNENDEYEVVAWQPLPEPYEGGK